MSSNIMGKKKLKKRSARTGSAGVQVPLVNVGNQLTVFGDAINQPERLSGLAWNSANKVYNFIQYIDQGNLNAAGPFNSSTSVPTATGIYFTYAQISNSGSFTSLFDQYRIAMIEVVLKPRANQATSAQNFGQWWTAVDVDDSATPSLVSLQQRNVTLVTEGYEPVVHRWVPHVATAAYSGAFTSFENTTAPWLDTSSNTVQHYGLKIYVGITSAVVTMDAFTRVHLQCRNII